DRHRRAEAVLKSPYARAVAVTRRARFIDALLAHDPLRSEVRLPGEVPLGVRGDRLRLRELGARGFDLGAPPPSAQVVDLGLRAAHAFLGLAPGRVLVLRFEREERRSGGDATAPLRVEAHEPSRERGRHTDVLALDVTLQG